MPGRPSSNTSPTEGKPRHGAQHVWAAATPVRNPTEHEVQRPCPLMGSFGETESRLNFLCEAESGCTPGPRTWLRVLCQAPGAEPTPREPANAKPLQTMRTSHTAGQAGVVGPAGSAEPTQTPPQQTGRGVQRNPLPLRPELREPSLSPQETQEPLKA